MAVCVCLLLLHGNSVNFIKITTECYTGVEFNLLNMTLGRSFLSGFFWVSTQISQPRLTGTYLTRGPDSPPPTRMTHEILTNPMRKC